MGFALQMVTVSVGLFLSMLLFLEIGRRWERRRLACDPKASRDGVGAMEGAVFGLLGLLAAFSFSGAASRFDVRRQLIVQETNAIGTAYLRLDMLAPSSRDRLRECFRNYLDLRLEAYRLLPDITAAMAVIDKSTALQNEIWTCAVTACREEGYQPAAILLLPALNEMIDITTTRLMATKTHPPTIVFIMLGGLMLTGAMLAGVDMAVGTTRSWLHILGFAAVLAITFYVILDLEFPRLGLIHVADFDQALIALRQSLK